MIDIYKNIKITVDNVAEDESQASGLWDLAKIMVHGVVQQIDDELLSDEIVEEHFDLMTQSVYNALLSFATYTDPEHYNNQKEEE